MRISAVDHAGHADGEVGWCAPHRATRLDQHLLAAGAVYFAAACPLLVRYRSCLHDWGVLFLTGVMVGPGTFWLACLWRRYRRERVLIALAAMLINANCYMLATLPAAIQLIRDRYASPA